MRGRMKTKFARSWERALFKASLVAVVLSAVIYQTPAFERPSNKPEQTYRIRVNGVELHYLHAANSFSVKSPNKFR